MSFQIIISQSREMDPNGVLRFALRGAAHISTEMQDVPLGRIDPEADLSLDPCIRQAAEVIQDLADGVADGVVAPDSNVVLTAQPYACAIWFATDRVAAWVLDAPQLMGGRHLAAVLAFVGDYRGQPLACLRGTNGGRTPAVPPHAAAAGLMRSLRLVAARTVLPDLIGLAAPHLPAIDGAELRQAADYGQQAYLEDNDGRRRRGRR